MASGIMPCFCAHRKMARKFRSYLGAALAVFSVSVASAQFKPANPARQQPPAREQAQDQTPTFSVKVDLVRLLVSVRDRYGKLITDLNKSEFQIFDSGTPQQIAVFERNTSLPLSVAVLIDTSGSTLIDLRYEVQSVQRFISSLLKSGNPADAFELFSFNWRTNLELDFSRNKARAERALRALHGEGGTSLYDAIFLASDTLGNREGRHVMIIVTDGGDTTSLKKYDDALLAAQQADAVLYPIVVIPVQADAGRNVGGEHALTTLAASTGGRIFNPQGFEQLDTAFGDILLELRTQYLLGFYPKDVRREPRLFHPVRVEIRDPQLKVSARTGYYEP
jgi:Ca-activated chloride channel family protein